MKSARLILILGVSAFLLIAFGYLLLQVVSGSNSVRRVDHVTPQLDHAIKAAQAGLPDYLKQLQHPKPGQRFAFMGEFRTPNGNEYLWVKDPSWNGKQLIGTLDQRPMSAAVQKGDTVKVNKADVVDWFIQDADGSAQGKFTEHMQ